MWFHAGRDVRLLVELIGPGAVGKSTIGPLLSEMTGIPHYAGQGFYGLDGEPLTRTEVVADRVLSVATRPLLFRAAWKTHPGTTQKRLSFALSTCRRERFAERVSETGSGIFSSGPVHWLCQECTRNRHDMTVLLPRVVLVDLYVKLVADPEELTRRLRTRGGKTEERIAEHHLWVSRYLHYADSITSRLDRPTVTVDANGPTAQIAEEIARLIDSQ